MTLTEPDLRGECGRRGTVPSECRHDHPCCALHAVENPEEPCISCRAGRQMAEQGPGFYARQQAQRNRRRRRG